MRPFLHERFGNPSSIHSFGRDIRNAVDHARDQVAQALHADPNRLIFTSGGTEADNLALLGVAWAMQEEGKNHIITSQVEHHAVLDTCMRLERFGFRVTYLPVDQTGQVDPDIVEQALDEQTALVSIMFGNNEVGTLQPIEAIGNICREWGVPYHTDAVQALGMEDVDVKRLPVDLVTVSGHKINGPKGVGALYVGREISLFPQMTGGVQERRLRAGTENVPGIVGFGAATEYAVTERTAHREQAIRCRKAMVDEWERAGIRFQINGHPEQFLPHILNVSFPGIDTEMMLMNLDMEGVACASGSACTSGTFETSHVLEAMKLPEDITRSAVRFSFGLGNDEEQVRQAARSVVTVIKRFS